MLCPVDWNAFKAKFKGASEEVFEYLAYLVFCRKYGLQFGIAGYRNHPGIEKKSIKVGDEYIGFQAKFFLEKFANKKDEIKEAIHDAKKQHPEITVLMFFMPMDHDFSPNKKGNDRATKAQIEVEKVASTVGLKKIEWFCHSEFQATMADESYSYWAAHFFGPGKDIFSFAKMVERCKERRFRNAKNSIDVNGFHVAIDRSGAIKTILESQDRTYVITGEGGVGKTSLLKSVDETLSGRGFYCVGLNELANCFDEQKLASSWHIAIKDFLDLHSDYSERILVVDEAEKTELLVPPGDTGSIAPILDEFYNAGWTIVFSSRSSHAEMWVNFCKESLHAQPTIVEIPSLLPEELNRIANENGFSVPSDFLLRDLLRIPFYLKEFLSLSERERSGCFKNFKQHLWDCRIRGSDSGVMAANGFIAMMERRLQTGNYWVEVHPDEAEAANGLIQRGILVRDTETEWCYLTHDIYEEWALEKIITRAFSEVGDNPNLWPLLQDKPAMHRAYRSWMTDTFHLNGTSVQHLVENSLTGNPTPWQKETLLAMLASPLAGGFLKTHLLLLLGNGGQLLKEVVALVRLSCREPSLLKNEAFLSDMGFDPASADFHFLTRPCGKEWNTIIHFLFENRKDVLKVKQDEILNLLHEWCANHPHGQTTAEAARLAFEIAIANNGTDWETRLFEHKTEGVLFQCLSLGAAEIKEDLRSCIEFYLDDPEGDVRGFPKNYCEAIVDHSLSHVQFITSLPETTRRILGAMFRPGTQLSVSWTDSPESEMGLSRSGYISHCPLSAYQTPVYWLLKKDFKETLDFLIDWINDLASVWAKSDTYTTTTRFTAEAGKQYEQYISNALWCANRGCGSPVLPHLFVCAHMALEKRLLEFDEVCHDDEHEKSLVEICLYIFQKAKTASLSGVLNTLVLKNPDRYYEIGSLLASSFEAIHYDYMRACSQESQCKFLYSVLRRDEKWFYKEREKTLNESFRFNSLEEVIRLYQSCPSPEGERRRKRMETLLDGFSKTGDRMHLLMVCRTDLRRMRFECKHDEKGAPLLVAYPQLPPDIAEEHQRWLEAQAPFHLGLGLKQWAEDKIKGNTISAHLRVYEADRPKLVADCKTVLSASYEGEIAFLLQNTKPVIAAALLKCCRKDLDDTMQTKCKQIVLQAVQTFLFAPHMARVASKLEMACVFSSLAGLADDPDQKFAKGARGFSLLGMLQESDVIGIDEEIFNAIRQKAEEDKGYEGQFLVPYLRAKTEFDIFLESPSRIKMLSSGKHSPEELFAEQKADFLEGLWASEEKGVLPAIGTYSAEAAKNCLTMIPDTALEDGVCKAVFLENIERVIHSICCDDEYRHDKHAWQYWIEFARLLLCLKAEDRENALAQVVKNPLALFDSNLYIAIIHTANKAKARTVFWEIWATLRPALGQLLGNRSLCCRQIDLEEALDAFFLGKSIWFGHPEDCKLIERNDLQFFDLCLEEWKMPLVAVVAFQSFLASAGGSFWEDGIPMLENALGHVQMGTDERLKTTLVEICGQYMKQMVKEHGDVIRTRTTLRQAALFIIEFLKAEKSQAGYVLENYVM